MKKAIFTFLALCFFGGLRSQISVDARTEEYSTVRAIISAETGKFSDKTTLPNPFLEMEGAAMELRDIVKDSKGVKFETLTDMLNYMNKFSWLLVGSEAIALKGTTPDVMILYTFKRKPKK